MGHLISEHKLTQLSQPWVYSCDGKGKEQEIELQSAVSQVFSSHFPCFMFIYILLAKTSYVAEPIVNEVGKYTPPTEGSVFS